MFAVIYQGYLKPGRENEYQAAWSKVAKYFIEYRGAIGSCLHRTSDGLWVAYSRWPDKKTRDNSWPGENAPSEELPLEIRSAVLTIKDCLDSDRKIPDLCMDVIIDLFPSSDNAESTLLTHQEENNVAQEEIIKDFGDIVLKESKICQFDDLIGAFANRDFKKGEVVINWKLKALSKDEYENLPRYEKDNFCHHRNGICWLYPDPERHVNRFNHPNLMPDFEQQANIALRDIKKGEELTIADNIIEDF